MHPGTDELRDLLVALLRAHLRDLGIFGVAGPGTSIRAEELKRRARDAGLAGFYERWLDESLRVLHEHGDLAVDTDAAGISYRITDATAVDIEALWTRWTQYRAAHAADASRQAQLALLEACLRALPAILAGRQPATDVMFPDSSMRLVEGVYRNNPVADRFNRSLEDVVVAYMEQRVRDDAGARIRILEIGAGTGGTTAGLLKRLRPFARHMDAYLYTDLSRAFLMHAQDVFAPDTPSLQVALFDVSRPWADQALAAQAGQFDIVIAANVLHATPDMASTLRHAKAALRRNGLLVLNELSGNTLFAHLTFGLLQGWWLYNDPDLRIPGSPALSPQRWAQVLAQEGFDEVWFPAEADHGLGQQIIVAQSDGWVREERARAAAPVAPAPAIPAALPAVIPTALPAALPATMSMSTPTHDPREQAIAYLKREVGVALKMAPDQIDATQPLATYGLDSILVVQLTNRLRQSFDDIGSTLFFEVQTVAALADRLLQTHKDALLRQLGLDEHATQARPPGDARALAARVVDLRGRARPSLATRRVVAGHRQDVAIIGVSGRYPQAGDLDAFWQNLRNARDCITEIPPQRWDWRQYFDPVKGVAGKTYSKWGGFIDGVDLFDPLFFHLSPREAERMDPQERLFLQEVHRCIESAGYTPATLSATRKVGVFAGVMNSAYLPQAMHWSIANRVSFLMDFRGPSMALDTACSSSLTAIHLALESLHSGLSECVLAGGVNLILKPAQYVGLSAMNMLSEGAQCKSFGAHADGFVDGEGVGVVLLKPLHQALLDGDRIWGVIKGSSINAAGRTNGYTVPSPAAQQDLIAEAIKRSGVDARAIGYIEAHGTGTALGDPIEIAGLAQAFGGAGREPGDAGPVCWIGSAKSNIGHLEAAAGIAGLTKVLLQMRHGQIAPSLHSTTLNPHIDFARTPFVVNQELRDWPRPVVGGRTLPRTAGISSFGAGGSNAHLIVQEYVAPQAPADQAAQAGPCLIVLSARNDERLREYAANLLAYIETPPEDSIHLSDLAYTLQVGREAMEERLGVIVNGIEDLHAQLTRYLAGEQGIERLYRGQVKKNKETLSALAGDEDMAQTVQTWIAKGKVSKLLELWVKGLNIDWNQLYVALKPRRIAAPTYPFARERYWVDMTPVSAPIGIADHALAATSGIDDPCDDDPLEPEFATPSADMTNNPAHNPGVQLDEPAQTLFFEEHWEATPYPAQAMDASTRLWVCWLCEPQLRQALAARIAQTGAAITLVFIGPGESFLRHSAHSYDIPGQDRAACEQVLRDIVAEHGAIDAVAYLWPLDDGRWSEDVRPVVTILQALRATQVLPRVMLLAGNCADALQGCHLESWIGFERSLGLVLPQVSLHVLLDDATLPEPSWADRIIGELRLAPGASVRYRDGVRHTLVNRLSESAPTGPSLIGWSRQSAHSDSPRGTILITGGCGGLGYLIALHLATSRHVNLILSARRAPDAALDARLDALRALGGAVFYLQADVADARAMELGIAQALERCGPIHGVIHAAGLESRLGLFDKSVEQFEQVLSPKVRGSLVLDDVLEGQPLEFICYFSSSAAILGDFGACDYAVANRFEMAYARHRNTLRDQGRRAGSAVVINWPFWRDGGMGQHEELSAALYLKSSGQQFLDTSAGLEIFERVMARAQPAQQLVLVGQPGRIRRFLKLDGATPAVAQARPRMTPAHRGRRAEMRGLGTDQCVLWDLKAQAGALLGIARDQLDDDTNLAEFGFDSISLAEYARQLSQHYGLTITPAVFFGHPTLRQLVAHFMTDHAAHLHAFYDQNAAPAHAHVAPARQALQAGAAGPRQRAGSRTDARDDVAEPIALIGMSGRFPDARDVDALWAILNEGRNAVHEIPAERFDWRPYYTPDLHGQPDKSNSKWLGAIPGVAEFDPLFFEISPREAQSMDPRQRLLLQESWKALEDAGYGANQLQRQRIGMFVGAEESDYQYHGGAGMMGNITATHGGILAARLAYFLNLSGPVMAINTACSSSLVALHQACQSLRANEIDTAIVAGVNLLTRPEIYIAMSQAGMLSADGQCYAFDRRANGLVPGEAIVVVVLKRAAQARAEGDPIHALIRASGVNYDGKTNGITAPSGVAQSRLLEDVYRQGGISPRDIGYVVAHGTGTRLGDPIEVNALDAVLRHAQAQPGQCALTSSKSNFGHTFAASGLVSVINLVQALRHETIPASLNCDEPSDYMAWADSPLQVNTAPRAWPAQPGQARLGAASAFGMSGTNAHVVLQDEPQCLEDTPALPYCVLALSAKTDAALREQIGNLVHWLEQRPAATADQGDLIRLSCTLLTGRHHLRHRCAIVIQDRDDAVYVWRQTLGQERRPNVFRGELKRDFSAQRAIVAYAGELVARTGALMGQAAAYQEALFALAELHCQGYEIPWDGLFGPNPPRRIAAPTYPFARECYWVEDQPGKTLTTVPSPGTVLHPLLHRNTSTLEGQGYHSHFTGDEFFLADHVVRGTRVLPGVAHLEMARAAVCDALGVVGPAGLRLTDVVWVRPLMLDDHAEQGAGLNVRIDLNPQDGNGGIGWEIRSETETETEPESDDPPMACSQGVAWVLPQEVAEDAASIVSLNTLQARINQPGPAIGALYAAFETMGLHYGAGHRALEQLWTNVDAQGQPAEVLARLGLPQCVAPQAEQYVLHPSLMDGALQASLALAGAGPDAQPLLPFALEQLDLIKPCTTQMWAWLRRGDNAVAHGIEKLDIDLYDETGQPCARLRGFTARRLDTGLETGAPATTMLAAPRWTPKPLSASDSAPESRLLVCCGFAAQAAGLRAGLEAVEFIGADADADANDTDLATGYEAVALRLFDALRTHLQRTPDEALRVQVLVPGHGAAHAYSGLLGLLQSARQENPRIRPQLIVVDDAHMEIAPLLRIVQDEARQDDTRIRYTQGQRQVGVWEPSVHDDATALPDRPWHADGVYLITGGAGGLGLLVAQEIVDTTPGARIILCARRAEHALDTAAQARLTSLQAQAPGCVHYRAADLNDRAAVHALIDGIVAEHGHLSGIVHSAGLIDDAFLIHKTPEQFARVLAPKVRATQWLDEATRDLALDWMVLFSSVAGALGNVGQTDYAAGNAFMDAFAAWRAEQVAAGQRQGRTVSIGWPLWDTGGMQVDAGTRTLMRTMLGLEPLPTRAGLRALHQALGQSDVAQVLVLHGQAYRLQGLLDRATAVPAAAAVQPDTVQPVESTAKLDLNELCRRLQEQLGQHVAQQLKLRIEDIDADSELSEYGFDSISLIEFANTLNARYGLQLLPTLFFEHPTLARLSRHLSQTHPELVARHVGLDHAPVLLAGVSTGAPTTVPVTPRARHGKSRWTAPSTPRPGAAEPIAIIGMSGRFPCAPDLDAFWANLHAGRDCIGEIPPERWDWRALWGDPLSETNKCNIKWGGFIDGVDQFDPLFFGISPREALLMDPQQRLLMQYVWLALEDAGHAAHSLSGSQTALYVGTSASGYINLIERAGVAIEGYSATGAAPSMGPNRMSYYLNWHGPSELIDTACSSSLVALCRAVQSLRSGECDQAVAGGINTLVTPDAHISLNKAGMLSEDGRCKTFSARANGYGRSEGVGMLMLKRLSDAERDGDRIHGVIRAAAQNHGGRANSLTAPNPQAQAALIESAWRQADIGIETASYIEAHGTGTPLGDPIEINGLKAAFTRLGHGQAAPGQAWCALGSVKTHIGHLELAAGVAGVIKVLLQMKHRTLIGNLHGEPENPYLALEGSPFWLVRQTQAWEARTDARGQPLPRRAGVSSFGFGGANAHVVLEEYRAAPQPRSEQVGPVAIVLSARNDERLKEYAAKLLAWINQSEPLSLSDLAYTLQVGREAMEERLGVIVNGVEDLQEQLTRYLAGEQGIERLYRGQVKKNKEAFSALAGDEDMAQTVQSWIAKGKVSKLLELWVKGLNVDWNQLYGALKPRRIAAPTYPFARERYWIDIVPGDRDSTWVPPVSHPRASTVMRSKPDTPAASIGIDMLPHDVTEHFRQLVGEILAIPVDRIDSGQPLQNYGMDSILVGQLIGQLRNHLSDIDSTLFFRFPTIDEIVDHLVRTQPEALSRWLAGESGEPVAVDLQIAQDIRGVCCVKPCAHATVRLLVFHPFGFGLKSLSWVERLPDDIEVWAVGADHLANWDALTSHLADQVAHLLDKPVVVWGHSMGGIVAFEVLHELERRQLAPVRQLILSSTAAPMVFERMRYGSPFYEIAEEMSDDDMRQVLQANQFLMPPESGIPMLAMSGIRNDVALCKSYAYVPGKRLNVPIFMVQANNDVLLKDPAVVAQWEQIGTGRHQYEEVEGTHLFFMRPPPGFLRILKQCCLSDPPAPLQTIAPGTYHLRQIYAGTADVHVYPLGLHPHGCILYTDDGHMAAHLWHPGRAGPSNHAASPAELFMTYLAYAGSYELTQGVVRHHVLVSTAEALEDRILSRHVDRQDGMLTLSTSAIVLKDDRQDSHAGYQKLTWAPDDEGHRDCGPAAPFAGAWRLQSVSGLEPELSGTAFKGQCLISKNGYLSVLVSKQDRAALRFQNPALASSDEIDRALASCLTLLGQLGDAQGSRHACKTLVSQACVSWDPQWVEITLIDGDLTLTWRRTHDDDTPVIMTWRRFDDGLAKTPGAEAHH